MEGETQGQRYTDMWKKLLEGFAGMSGFAVFSHGSAVILKRPHATEESAKEEALEVMKQYGPVFPGSEAGDFNTTSTKGRGSTMRCNLIINQNNQSNISTGDAWMVSGYHGNLMTLVLSKGRDEEVENYFLSRDLLSI